jgi:hypothetical protein
MSAMSCDDGDPGDVGDLDVGYAALGSNGDHDLPVSAFVPEFATVRGRSLVQKNGGFDECSERSSVKLPGDFNQLLLIRLDNEVSVFYSLVGCAFALRGNGDHASTWLEDTP